MADDTNPTVNTAITNSEAASSTTVVTGSAANTDGKAAVSVEAQKWQDRKALYHKGMALNLIISCLDECSTTRELCSRLGSTENVECLIKSPDLSPELDELSLGYQHSSWKQEIISALHVALSETNRTPAAFRTVIKQWVKDNGGSAASDEAPGDVQDEGSDGCAQGKETHKDLIGDHEDGKETGTPVDEARQTRISAWKILLDDCKKHLAALGLNE